jgi:hypothetical protein
MNYILIHLDFTMNSLSVKQPETVKLDYLHGEQVLQKLIKKFPIFHGTQCFVIGSQQPTLRFYPKPHESSPNAHTTFL